jgi:CRISPR/Cas system-associated protein endoribonuclease Cas2
MLAKVIPLVQDHGSDIFLTNPETGESVCLALPESNTTMMNLFLGELHQQIDTETHCVLVLDQTAWHHSK